MSSKLTRAPPRNRPPSSSTPCSTACPFPFAPCRSTAARNSPPSSNRLVSSAACICSCCRHARPNSMVPSNAPTVPHRGVLSGYALLAGDEETQSRTPAVGNNLQHRASSSGPRLLNPAAVLAPDLIPTKGMKSVTYLLDEYNTFFQFSSRDKVEAGACLPERGLLMEGLKDKVAIVTGGATMIGAHVVRAFHRAGCRVVLADIAEKDGQAIAAELRPTVLFVKTDLADDAQVAACVEKAVNTFGGIDFLINLACVYIDNALESTRQEWLDSYNVNVVGGALMLKTAPPPNGQGGG